MAMPTSHCKLLHLLSVAILFSLPISLPAQIVMDVFGGWDGRAISQRWIPVVVEVSNKGLPISGFIEIHTDGPLPERLTLTWVEIPMQTTKRIWVYLPPMTYPSALKVALLNHRQRMLYEVPLKLEVFSPPSRLVAESIPSGWLKMGLSHHRTRESRPDWISTRMLKQHLPDAAVGYDGLDALHLGWSDVSDLNSAQRQALLDWIWCGGHLIVSAEDSNAWRSDRWWSSWLPFHVDGQQSVSDLAPLGTWLHDQSPLLDKEGLGEVGGREEGSGGVGLEDRSPVSQPSMASMETLVGTGVLQRGHVLIAREGIPLAAQLRAGRGFVTQLLFNPGRAPFRDWQERSAFWLHLAQSAREYTDACLASHEEKTSGRNRMRNVMRGAAPGTQPATSTRQFRQHSVENFMANFLLTRQQRELPWVLLSALLAGYVVLIGPFDYIWLKRRRKLVWTWLTFPAYVVCTTAVIYVIGHWVNAGESEWRQWTVVDWLQDNKRQRLITSAWFYSTRNANYEWGDAPGLMGQMRDIREEGVRQTGGWDYRNVVTTPAGSRADVAVPVWTSCGFLGRLEQASGPLDASFDSATKTLRITNPTQMVWKDCRLITDHQHYKSLRELKPGETRVWHVNEVGDLNIDTSQLGESMVYYAYRGYHQTEIPESKRLDLEQGLFFAPRLQPDCQAGSVGEGMDLSSTWQEGDAVFIATSDAPKDWPWRLGFNPKRQTHTLTHRIYFSAGSVEQIQNP